MTPKKMTGKITKIEKETPTMRRYTIKLPEPLDFKPGQFVMLNFPEDETLKRAYSVANEPGKDEIELIIRTQGKFTNKLEQEAKPGTKLIVHGPFGHFYFDEETEKRDLVLLGAGCGITPLRSILHYIKTTNKPNKVTLFLSSRDEDDVPCAAEIKEINQTQSEKYNVIQTYTRLPEEHPWQGERGRINADMIKKHIPGYQEKAYYICGSPGFSEQMTTILKELGVPDEQVHKEQW